MLSYSDIHAHLADERIRDEFAHILQECKTRGLAGVLACAARRSEWDIIASMADQPGVYGALGVHPFFLDDWQDELVNELQKTVSPGGDIPAIGEIGLDFYHDRADADQQRHVFTLQIEAAVGLGVPVVVHNRKSWNEFFDVLSDFKSSGLRGVCHHFTGSREVARKVLDAGFYLSFCGPLTYSGARRIKDAAIFAPLDRILTETDTPDLPTAQHRGELSYPWHVAEIVEEISHLKKLPPAHVAGQVMRNFKELLGVELPVGQAV